VAALLPSALGRPGHGISNCTLGLRDGGGVLARRKLDEDNVPDHAPIFSWPLWAMTWWLPLLAGG
jgi:hypothetical protein